MVYHLKRSYNLVEITPWPNILEPELSYKKIIHAPGKPLKFITERLFTVVNGSGIFPAGLFTRVFNLLSSIKGVKLEVVDYRDMARLMPMPDFSKVDLLRPGQEKILTAVAANEGGLLVGGCGLGKTFLITQICKMYTTLNILILSPRVSVVNTIYDNLTRCISSEVITKVGGGGSNCKEKRRITVSTTKSILKCNLKECDLLLFDEAHNVGSNQIAEHLAYIERGRKFGFTATPAGRSDGADLVIEAIFGPKIADIPYMEAVKHGLVTPIEVRTVKVTSSPYIPDSELMVTKKRWNYWRNTNRNKVIAQVARMLPSDEQVLIMVETLEHALNLHKLLPEYTLVHYGSVTEERAKRLGHSKEALTLSRDELDKYRTQFEDGTLKKVIATSVWAEGVNFPKLSCLIRADGAPGEIKGEQIPGRLSRLAEGKNVGILIDFIDEFSPWAKRRSIARMSFYRRRGWKIQPLHI